ncbi:hypothetical protein D3C87_1583840 [compost metagenome]
MRIRINSSLVFEDANCLIVQITIRIERRIGIAGFSGERVPGNLLVVGAPRCFINEVHLIDRITSIHEERVFQVLHTAAVGHIEIKSFV